jgi:threonine dehydrogenase-like Zn-dependent dehydrogenase
MRAVVIAGPRRAEISEKSIPEPAPDEVLVRLEGCGVAASNLPVWEGRERYGYPRVAGAPGREGWGRVEAIGAAVEGISPGDRVALLSNHAFAEYDTANSGEVVRLPDSGAGKPFPGASLGCAMNVFRRSRIEPGQNVAVIGVGFLGALLTQLAARAGARVIAVSRRQFALEMARRCGAAETIAMGDDWRAIERVIELTDGEGCERVIEATGAQQALDLATELARERGWLVIAGDHQEGPRQVNLQLWSWRGLDVINAHEHKSPACVAGMQAALDAIADGELDPEPLYTHRFRLDQLDRAMEMMRRRPDGFLKALITM